jgi:Ca2+-binding RTX toxin-like protein
MAKLTLKTNPSGTFDIQDVARYVDWALFDADMVSRSSTEFRLGGTVNGQATTAVVKGTGFTYDQFSGLRTGTIQTVSYSFSGKVQAEILGSLPVAALRAQVAKELNGSDPLAIENYLMGFDWTYIGPNRSDTAFLGSRVGDGALFNLRGNDNIKLNGGNDNFYSGDGNDRLDGGTGNDRLNAGAGTDIVIGGAGVDIFIFTAPVLAKNKDSIMDFNRASDTMHLDNAVFTQIGPVGTLKSFAFKLATQAKDGDDRIIYNESTGALFYDADGNGPSGAIRFATLVGSPTINHLDFVVI